jgi:hypothetical protein
MLVRQAAPRRTQRLDPLARAEPAPGTRPAGRRAFLKGTGLAAGAAAFASQLPRRPPPAGSR